MERAGARSLPSTTTEECGRRELAVWHMGKRGGEVESWRVKVEGRRVRMRLEAER
jgi:hypothetical protein